MSTFGYRLAERDANCRDCDKVIKRGDYMVSGYSWRNRGQYIHFCPECVVGIYNLIPKEKLSSIVLYS